jgi:WD40 repeat protein
LLSDAFAMNPRWNGGGLIHAFLAMANHRQRLVGETRYELQSAARAIDDLTQEMLRTEVGQISPHAWVDLLASVVLYREARMLIKGAAPLPDPRLDVARARGFLAIKAKDSAVEACAKGAAGPAGGAVRLECALLYGELGQWDKALPLLGEARDLGETDPNLGSWWFALALAHGHAGDNEQARQWYGRATRWVVKNQPRDAKLRRLRTEAAALLGIQDHRCFRGHAQQVRSAVFAPDGSRALSAGQVGTVRLWDVAAGKELRCLRGHRGPVWNAALSPVGHRALSGGSDRTMRLWDLDTGQELRRFHHPPGWVLCVAFSPDGRRALSACFSVLHLWDLESGRELARWQGHADWVRAVAFSPDGRWALSGGQDKTVRLWALATGKEVRRFVGHDAWVLSVAFSPDGRQALSGGCDQTVRLWDVPGGAQLGSFRGHRWNVESVVFSPDGRRALSGGADGTIRLWELPGGRELHAFGSEDVLGVAFSPDGRQVLSAHADNLVRLWRLPEEPKGTAAAR